MRDLVERVAALRQAHDRSVSVGISGVDTAGKSTLADTLTAALEPPVVVVAGDELTRPTRERYRDPDEALSYYRDSFDYARVFDVLLPFVAAGRSGELPWRVTDWEHDDWRDETLVVPERSVVVVEGCFLFTGRESAFDLTVWLDLPLDLVVERAIPRDAVRMGGPDEVRARFARRYLPGQALHLARDDPRSRAVVVYAVARSSGGT